MEKMLSQEKIVRKLGGSEQPSRQKGKYYTVLMAVKEQQDVPRINCHL